MPDKRRIISFPKVKTLKTNGRAMPNTAGGRLRGAMAASLQTPESVSTALNVSVQIVRSWMRQTTLVTGMSADNATQLSKLLNVSTTWLIQGTGWPDRGQAQGYSEQHLVAIFRKLDERDQHILVDVGQRLMRETKGK